MNRRHFVGQTAVGSVAGSWFGSVAFANLKPTDLRPPAPIGLARPSRPVTRENVAELRVRDPRSVVILQFTDLHFFCDRGKHGEAADQKTRDEVARMVAAEKPDLIAFTGDVWHDPDPGKSGEIFAYALESMSSLGVPWLFTWGNHDLLEDVPAAQTALAKAAHSLYRGAYSAGNYRVRLVSEAGGKSLCDLYCLNTTTQGAQADQEAWLASQSPSEGLALCFLHIPLLEYIPAWENRVAGGVKHEEVCTYGEDGSAFPLIKRLGVRACFCGHDHVNDYGGRVQGVEMIYGRATGHAGYGGETLGKGGKRIVVNGETGDYAWTTVFADRA